MNLNLDDYLKGMEEVPLRCLFKSTETAAFICLTKHWTENSIISEEPIVKTPLCSVHPLTDLVGGKTQQVGSIILHNKCHVEFQGPPKYSTWLRLSASKTSKTRPEDFQGVGKEITPVLIVSWSEKPKTTAIYVRDPYENHVTRIVKEL